jgi:hypothetical protein
MEFVFNLDILVSIGFVFVSGAFVVWGVNRALSMLR